MFYATAQKANIDLSKYYFSAGEELVGNEDKTQYCYVQLFLI
jgi:hypothetical protein